MRSYLFLFSVIFILQLSFVYSQTLEMDFLKNKESKINCIMKTKERNEKLKIVQEILNCYEKERFSDRDKKLVEIAEKLAMEGVFDQEIENNRVVNNFPEVRMQAVKLLAKLGGDKQRDLVMNIFISDDDLEVKAEACEAFITLGENENGDVIRTVIYVYRRYQPRYPKLIFAIISAMREFVTVDSPSYDEAIFLLTEIKTGGFNNNIKDKAKEAIDHILSKA